MHRPEGSQPASHLIALALSELRVFSKLVPPVEKTEVIAVNDCNDDRTFHNKNEEITKKTGYTVLPIPFFGSFIRMARLCPGYTEAATNFMLGEFKTGVVKRHANVICAGAHGEECAWCAENNVTVAQRIWLSRDAKYVLKAAACPDDPAQWWIPGQELRVFVTFHRKYQKHGVWHQRTRVIDCKNEVFSRLTTEQVMTMTDEQVLEVIAPLLLHLVGA